MGGRPSAQNCHTTGIGGGAGCTVSAMAVVAEVLPMVARTVSG